MAIDKVLADVAVDDFASALTWYERPLGRPADAAPMDGLAEGASRRGWGDPSKRLCGPCGIVQRDPRDEQPFDEQLAALEAEGIHVGPIQGTPGFVKAATVSGPEGNEITFAEDLTDKT